MLELDHRAQRVLDDIAAKREPSEDYSEAMRYWHAKNSATRPKLSKTAKMVFAIRKSRYQAEILEALLLSKCPASVIFDTLKVPETVTAWYAELFFDTEEAFQTGLDLLEYLEDYEDDWGKDLKIRAVNLGYEFVLFTYANIVPKTESQKKLVERMFMATAYKAMSMNYSGIKTDISKNAVRHAELMLKAYDALVKTSTDDSDRGYDLVSLLAKEEREAVGQKLPKLAEIL